MAQAISLNDLPDEIIELICDHCATYTLVRFSFTDSRLRSIVKPYLESLAKQRWPWTSPEDAYRSVGRLGTLGKKLQRAIRKNSGPITQTKTVVQVEIPAHCIHTNEPIPKEAVLLSERQLQVNHRDFSELKFPKIRPYYLDFESCTLHSKPRTVFPPGCHSIGTLRLLNGTRDSRGHIIHTHCHQNRIWAFARPPDCANSGFYMKQFVHNEWLYMSQGQRDGSQTIIKHHCTEAEISDKPDYVVSVPPSDLEGYVSRVTFTPEHIFVGYAKVPEYDEDMKPVESTQFAQFYLLDLDTGVLRGLCAIPLAICPTDVWLDGPSFFGCNVDRLDSLIEVAALPSPWSIPDSLYYQPLDLPEDPNSSNILHSHFWTTCVQGFFTYGTYKIIDLRTRRLYYNNYKGKCITYGLLDGELHWWTFPEADKMIEAQMELEDPVYMCRDWSRGKAHSF
ncbi:hypothetical protein CJU89_1611 [Yarrowia sp. B02]|nr:hypothetical protein CJU89_1611 [Yarrowia sp. B02]